MVVLVLVLGMVALGAVDPEARHVVPELDPGVVKNLKWLHGLLLKMKKGSGAFY